MGTGDLPSKFNHHPGGWAATHLKEAARTEEVSRCFRPFYPGKKLLLPLASYLSFYDQDGEESDWEVGKGDGGQNSVAFSVFILDLTFCTIPRVQVNYQARVLELNGEEKYIWEMKQSSRKWHIKLIFIGGEYHVHMSVNKEDKATQKTGILAGRTWNTGS